jgi:KaiC/GvpD/RAD55 family RecA-like ATPase
MSDQLPTGVDAVDECLGGVPAGSVIALTAGPASRAERILYEFVSVRRTLYLTVTRSEAAVEDALKRSGVGASDCVVQKVNADCPLDHAYRLIRRISDRATVVIDPVDAMERAGDTRLTAFLNTFRSHLADVGSIGVLHCLDGRSVSPRRDITEHMVDGILSVTTEDRGDAVETRLTVPKFRGKPPTSDPIIPALDHPTAAENNGEITAREGRPR